MRPESSDFIEPDAHVRNVEEMQMHDTSRVRDRCNQPLALERMSSIDVPLLVMGRDDDHLQGIFKLSYDLLVESGNDAAWVSFNHPLHGYIFPATGADGRVEVDQMQEEAIDVIIAFLDRHLKPAS